MSTSPMQTEPTGLVREGEVLAGKYRVERVLGAGGMGVVLAATHLQLEEKVAIKLLLPAAIKSPKLAERFLQEARASAKIKSEHVARVTDVGTLESGTPYMVMEYLSGCDLAHLLETSGPLQMPVAVDYVLQACEALAEAHALGIVHRDLKPANLYLTQRADGSPCVKVLDFGISKVTTGGNPRITDTTAVMGSPFYMSPEQLKSSRDVDARTDIWSLGVILFELLSGSPPFDRETMPQLCLAIMQDTPRALGSIRQDIHPALEAVIQRCLEKSPERRFRSVGDLADALVPFVTGRARLSAERASEISRVRGPVVLTEFAVNSPMTTSRTMLSTSPSWSGTMPPHQRQRRLAIVVAGVLLSLGLGVFVTYLAVGRTNGAADPPEPVAAASIALPPPAPPSAAASPGAAPATGGDLGPGAGAVDARALQVQPSGAPAVPASASGKASAPRPPATPTSRPGRPPPPPPPPAPSPPPPAPAPTPHAPPNLFDDRK